MHILHVGANAKKCTNNFSISMLLGYQFSKSSISCTTNRSTIQKYCNTYYMVGDSLILGETYNNEDIQSLGRPHQKLITLKNSNQHSGIPGHSPSLS